MKTRQQTPITIGREILGDYSATFYSVVGQLVERSNTKHPTFPVRVYEKGKIGDPLSLYAYLICEELRRRGLVSRDDSLVDKDTWQYQYKTIEDGKKKLEAILKNEPKSSKAR